MKENIAISFFRQHICNIFVRNTVSDARSMIFVIFDGCYRLEIEFLHKYWKCTV